MSGKFRIERVCELDAAVFWNQSPQATGFNHPDVLSALSQSVDWWGAWRSEDLVAIWPICRTIDGQFRPPVFAYYVGPMFSQEIHGFKYHRYWAIRQTALEILVGYLATSYKSFSTSLPVGFTDVRAFDWWNHDHPEGPHFDTSPRQTVRIGALQKSEPDAIRQGFARNRKRDIKTVDARPPEMTDDWTISDVLSLHDGPLHRQGEEMSPSRRETLERLVTVVSEGFGKVLAFRNEQVDGLASAIVLLYGPCEANNVLCVANPDVREQGVTAWTTWQGILQARADGKNIFDFNGANSPQRAADKHCYNAVDDVYFNVHFNRADV